MALKTVIPFPIFAPIPPTTNTTTTTSTTEVRFSRWNNANAENLLRHRRTQQQIEDDLRRLRRFQSALNISNIDDSATPITTTFKSTGTPSTPSISSIPGKKSKYSKPPKNPNPNPNFNSSSHPAFRKLARRSKLPQNETARREMVGETEMKVGEKGVSYVVPGAPFEFMYSYTEAPKGKPIGLREPAVAPFGPGTMARPWTGRKPLPGSKKEVPEFDSFRPPPAGKKGVKPVQKPGPFLAGSGPRYVMSREEVLGEALTEEEVKELVEGCRKTKRQLNMGRDGLTHNMLDNIHAHWKRRRVCKIRCKGVCTVDMDNVCQQLEEKTGGKIIYRRGGIVYLFRGRNYNYKTRPRFPLMLWKPVTPVYPRLIQRVPEGLTLEEATDMRKRGRELTPICKLGKNGVYVNLAKHVREAFEACELVRINCQGLNPSDYRKIGAKLKDLVPCVLISFENEHILMWRGRDWKSSLLPSEDVDNDDISFKTDNTAVLGSYTTHPLALEDEQVSACSSITSNHGTGIESPNSSKVTMDDSVVGVSEIKDTSFVKNDVPFEANSVIPPQPSALGSKTMSDFGNPSADDVSFEVNDVIGSQMSAFGTETMSNSDNPSGDDIGTAADDFDDLEVRIVDNFSCEEESTSSIRSDSGPDTDDIVDVEEVMPGNFSSDSAACGELRGMAETLQESSPSTLASPCIDGVLFLLRQALESGTAVILDDSSLDADVVYERSVALAQIAPPGPVFRHRPRKVAVQKLDNQEVGDLELDKAVAEKKSNEKKSKERKTSRIHKAKDIEEDYLDMAPQGSLKIDELAKLLA